VRTVEPVTEKVASPTESLAFWREFREGLRFCAQNRLVLTILISSMLYALGGGLGNAIFVFFALQNLHIPVSLFGTITGALGVGSICGALLAPWLAARLGAVRLFWTGMMVAGLLFLVYAQLNSFLPALVVDFVVGIPLATLYTVVGPMIMHTTPRHLLGRVTGMLSLCQSFFTIVATMAAGILTSTLLRTFHAKILGMLFGTYDTIVTLEGLFILLSGIYAWWKLGKLRGNE
jgi:Na+/melibiose symporter-like transporter